MLHRVLENHVMVIPTAHQVSFAVTVVKVLLANVLHRVLENRVIMIPTADQVNIVVVLIGHVP